MKKYTALLLGVFPMMAMAGQRASEHDPIASILLWVTLLFSLAIAGRIIARRCKQPGVLGELLMGVLLGNACYFFGCQMMMVLREGPAVFSIVHEMLSGLSLKEATDKIIPNPFYAAQLFESLSSPDALEFIKVSFSLDFFARFGVIFLLFMVGLESSFEELRHTGRAALQVAVIGVIAPIILGFLVAYLLIPDASYHVNLFVAATLSATSIGITARVLSDMKTLRTREARTILGAAMLDDVFGLIILAIVSSIVINGQIEITTLLQVIIASALFFTLSLMLGPWFLRQFVKWGKGLEAGESKLFISFFFVMLLAWLATIVQLAAIIGAFVAGMIINDLFFETNQTIVKHHLRIKDFVAPLEFLFTPIFFMLIGIQVKVETFFDWHVLLIAIGLTVAAIVGKLLSGLGADNKDDRLLIGIGMLPRGEVGLVFASIGRTLGVISDQIFSAIIVMIMVTTLIVPPLLKKRYTNRKRNDQHANR